MFKPKFDFGDVVYWIADSAVHRGTVRSITIEASSLYKETYDVVVPCKYGDEHHSLDVRELYSCKEDAEEILQDEVKEYKRLRIEHLDDTLAQLEERVNKLREERDALKKEIE